MPEHPELSPTLLETWIPRWQFREAHSIETGASFDSIRAAVREVTPDQVPLARFLLWLRQPFSKDKGKPKPFLEAAQQARFLILEDQPSELVLGLVGRFWTPSGGRVAIADRAAFAAFETPGFAKAVVNFRIIPTGKNRYALTTETRILTLGRAATIQFGMYWWLAVRWGSGWVRMLWLRAIRDQAERAIPSNSKS